MQDLAEFRSFTRRTARLGLAVTWCLVLAALAWLGPRRAEAIPARPDPVTFTQPDGSRFLARLRGDERYHWHETSEGYTILQDPATKVWSYAARDKYGRLVSSGTAVAPGQAAPAGLAPHLKPDAGQMAVQLLGKNVPVTSTRRTAPTTGSIRGLVILANFSDTTTRYTQAEFNSLFNQLGYSRDGCKGSVRDYFREVSYRKFDLQHTVADWVKLPRDHVYYDSNYQAMVRDALDLVDAAGMDFTQFDSNGDGEIDSIDIIHQGFGEEFGGNSSTYIWSHQWELSPPVVKDGITISSYHTEPEIYGWESFPSTQTLAKPGTICHETGHFLGLPDLYDTTNDDGPASEGAGDWELMASGAGNGSDGSPAHLSSWCKSVLGWLQPKEITSSRSQPLPSIATSPRSFKIVRKDDPREYFLLENRAAAGFDAGLPANGLLVWHIDDSKWPGCFDGTAGQVYNCCNCDESRHYLVNLIQADGRKDLEATSGGNRGDAGDPFPGSTGRRELNDQTTPSSQWFSGASGVRLSQISDPATTMTVLIEVPSTAPQLDLETISVNRNRMPVGEQVAVTVSVRNNGATTALVDRSYLVFSSDVLSGPVLELGGAPLPPDATADAEFIVTGVSAGVCLITSLVVEARNAADGTALGLSMNRATPVTVTVFEPRPELKLVSIMAPPATIGVGGTVPVTLEFRNDGQHPARLSRVTLVLSNANLSAAPWSGELMVPPDGGTGRLSFVAAGVSAGTCEISSATVSAVDSETSTPAALAGNEASPVTITVEFRGPVLRLESLESSVTALAVGETFPVTLTLRNDGNVGVDILLARLTFSNARLTSPAHTAVEYVAAGSGRARFVFTVTAASEGPCDLTSAAVTATSEADGSPVAILENQASPIHYTIVRPGPMLKLVSLAAGSSLIGLAQSIPVTVSVRNDGTAAALVTGIRLTLSSARAASPALVLSEEIQAEGGVGTFTFSLSGVSAGVCSITSATLTATNVFDGQAAVLAANQVSPVAVNVTSTMPALKLTAITITKDRLSVGQSVPAEVTLRNDGKSSALVSKAWLGLWNSRLSAGAASPALTLAPGQSGTVPFTVTAVSVGTAGLTTLTFQGTNTLTGQAIGLSGNLVQPKPVMVQTPAALTVEPLRLGLGRAILGQAGVRVEATVRNPGAASTGAAVSNLSGTLRVGATPAGFTVTPQPGPVTPLSASQSVVLTWFVEVLDTAVLGPTQLSAQLQGYDANTGELCPVSQPAGATLTVMTPAALRVDSVTISGPAVVRGQTGIVVRSALTNTADASTGTTATSLAGGLRFGGTGAGYRVTPDSANPAELAAGRSAELTFSVDVLDYAPRGTTVLTASPRALDAVGGTLVPVASAASATWTVLAPGALEVTSLAPATATLSRGQTALPLRLGVHNAGDFPIALSGAPLFSGSTAGFLAVTGPANVTALTTGQSALLTYTVEVLANAPLGPVSVSSGLSASHSASGLPAAVSDPARGNWLIQSAAALRVDSVRPGRSEVVQGLARVPVEVSVSNSGLATSGALAVGLSAALRFNGSSGGYLATPAPANAVSLAAARSAVLTFSVDVLPAATAGTVALTAQVLASDANSGTAASLANTASSSWTVKTPAALQVIGVVPASSTATQGQRRLPVEVSVLNTGQTTCESLVAAPSFAQYTGFLTATPAQGNPTRLAGGATAVLTFTVDVRSDTPALTLSIGASAEGRETFTRAPLAAVSTAPATLRILEPAALLATDWHATARRVSRGQSGVPLEVSVFNGGQTGLSRLAASLAFPGPAGVFRSSAQLGNATVLASGGSCVLTFSVDVLATAPLGSAAVTAVVTAVGDGSGHLLSWTVDPAASWTVVEPAALSLTALRLQRSTVTHGQHGVRLEVSAANTGQAEADGVVATPLFGGSTGGFLVLPDSSNPTTVATGRSITLTFTAEVLGVAPPGPVTVTAALQGRDRPSGNPCRITSGPSAVWTVQTTPVLGLVALTVSRASLAVGQTAAVTATFRNDRSDSATVRFAGWQPVASSSLVLATSRAALPGLELAGGSERSFESSVTALAPGTATLLAALAEAVDVNTGGPVTLAWNHVVTPSSLAVGRPPTARVTGPASLLVVDRRPTTALFDAGASSDPDGGPLGFAWRQVSGPAAPQLPPASSTLALALTVAGHYEFAVTVTDGLGLASTATATLDVLANASPVITIPSTLAGLTHERVSVPVSVTDPDGDPVAFLWNQESGPITLTFVAGAQGTPALQVTGLQPGAYRLRLTASDPRSGLSSSAVNLQLTSAPLAPLDLGIGVNLVSVPVSPFTTDGHVYSSADLARDTGGSIVARLGLSPTGWTRFTPDLPDSGKPFPILPGEGYAVICRRPMRLGLPGRGWPGTSTAVILRPRLVLVGYPTGVPAGESAQNLSGRTGARFVARTRVDATGHARFEVHVPGLTQPFPIRPGDGYLFSLESKTNAVLPGGQ
jgi:M6 family metalloprotease-like protein